MISRLWKAAQDQQMKKEQEQDSFLQEETENEHGDCSLSILMGNAVTKQAVHFPKTIECFQVKYYYMSLL